MKNFDFEFVFVVLATCGTFLALAGMGANLVRHLDQSNLQFYKANMTCRAHTGIFEADRVCGPVPKQAR